MWTNNPQFPPDSDLVAGRKMAAADLRMLILSLLATGPRHGYEIIGAVQTRSLGFYRPSPGVIYPALSHIKKSGLASAENVGARRRYRITPAGLVLVQERRGRCAALWDRLERSGQKLGRMSAEPPACDAVLRARAALDRALCDRARAHPDDQLRIARILNRAAAVILATDRPATPAD